MFRDYSSASTYNAVPAKNATDNSYSNQVIGNKTDDEDGDSIYAKLYIAMQHIHSAQKVYPTLAAGVTLTGGVASWALGSFVEVVPASTITSPFDIHHVNVGAASANDTYEIVLYKGALSSEVEVGRCRITRVANVSDISPVPMMTPILPANTRISAKVASASGGSDTVVISIFYHIY